MLTFDLGSNTLRILEFDCLTQKRINAFEKIVRTAKDLHKTNMIAASSQKAIIDALDEASKLFDFKSHKCFCVTTEAMRKAHNATQVLNTIEIQFGLKFDIISGEREAYLTSLAIENALKRESLISDTYVLFDLGGGSTEITFSYKGIKESKSFPFGIVTMAEKYTENIASKVTEIVSNIDSFIQTHGNIPKKYLQLVTTAGTPTTVSAFIQGLDYEHYDYNKVNGSTLHMNDFQHAFERLSTMPPLEAERYTGTNRKDLIIVGILIVQALMQKLGFTTCVVMDDGLREGVAIANCNNFITH
ncbi:MAG: phosphatase [Sulfurospirillaceae bacterium]|jgi:exopolyphosphatase/guanosine-5'-triphosphate,3'-diphosphate pyrophosphatase|nr:phosphatase [Sulfurospirillaceae bacterium]MDD2827778.1 phosphatase [Sulfurospirillaceae bacterium]